MEKFNNIFDDEFPSSFSDDPKAKKLPPNRIRKHTVTVRLNDFELKQINDLRNQASKSCWLRSSALQQLPPSVPEINREAWHQLTASLQKLNDLTSFLSRRGTDAQPLSQEVNALKVKLSHVRDALLKLNE
ncbi:hypothetical protein WKH27_13105 [Pantoea agglomerans]|uniref:Mobilization protein n=1 Tax=Enterobacter agglomerans TaxID=549 RepID=A0A379AJG9_ENTAG|nr:MULTISPECIES: hypothetical protein [Pantoea]MCX2904511.1 hypothetical protein [[Curtobacterium] plantarum]QXB58165.1 hypothetical protein I6L77_16270 [Pantoea agglomerans]SUB17981.1 Uncharacterised protein [Pantoea agglomerans]